MTHEPARFAALAKHVFDRCITCVVKHLGEFQSVETGTRSLWVSMKPETGKNVLTGFEAPRMFPVIESLMSGFRRSGKRSSPPGID